MSMRTLVFAVLAALPLSVLAQEPAPTVVPAPRLVCEAPVFNFGTVDNAQSVEHTFVLRNEGDLSLEIGQVRPSCGCTVASVSERMVPPGGETRITSRLSLAGRQGQQHKVITIESNDPKQPQFTLTLTGVAGVAVDVQPTRIVQAQIPVGAQPTNAVMLTGLAGTPFEVLAVEANSDRVSARVETVESGRVYRVLVYPTKPLEPGQLDANLTIRTDHPQRPTVEIPVSFMALSDLVVAPRELVFPIASEEPVTRYIIVRATGQHAFQLSHVEAPEDGIKTEVTPFGPNGYRIQILNLRPRMDLNQKVIRIHTAIPGQPPLEVPLRIIAPAPAPSPAP